MDGNVDLTLVASWNRGTLDGESSPTLDIIDYVPGSASNAYNSTPPVIDTVNRTITWTIISFPGSTTNQQVTFKLATNHSYTGTTVATFTVSAQSSGAAANSAVSSVTKEYLYDPSLEPTPTPTTVPRPSDLPFRFIEIGLETVSATAVSIRDRTTQNATAVLSYGTATNALTESVSDLTLLRDRLIRLSGLKENTPYFFRITAKNASGGEMKETEPGKYEPISPQVFPIPNPIYTDPSGTIRIVLPQGRYRADITTILNKPSRADFTIGPGVHEGFPTVYLDPEPFSPIAFIRYQWETCLEVLATLRTTMETMTKSLRLFELNAYFLLLLFVVFTYIALAKRMRIPLRSLRSHLGYRLKASYYSSVSEKRIEGKVTDSASNETLSGAHVYLIDPRFNTVLSHALSKPNGTFVFPVYDTHRYVLEVMKDGYAPSRFHEDSLDGPYYTLRVERHTSPGRRAALIGDNMLSLGLELCLVLSLILEILFTYVFGWAKTAPFIILSLFNLFLVVLHRLDRDK